MQAIKVSTAKLKEDIKAQNHVVYVEKSHIGKQLHCAHGADAAQKRQEIEDLQRRLSELQKKKLLEQHAHKTVEEHFGELQSTLQTITASWGTKLTSDSDLKAKLLEDLKQKHKLLLAQFREFEIKHTRESALKQERETAAKAATDAENDKRLRAEVCGAAAARIQAHWRGYKARQGARNGKDKGKKGKKKK
eukprot:jgi/Ulvmu1/12048/UM083_0061.1